VHDEDQPLPGVRGTAAALQEQHVEQQWDHRCARTPVIACSSANRTYWTVSSGPSGTSSAHPIDHIVQESKCKTARSYIEKRIPTFLSRMAYAVSPQALRPVHRRPYQGHGFGSVRVSDIRKNRAGDDQVRLFVQYPYSLPSSGRHPSRLEVASGRDSTVTAGRWMRERPLRGGDACRRSGRQARGAGQAVRPPQSRRHRFQEMSRLHDPRGYLRLPLDLGRGMIFHPETGQRIAIIAPTAWRPSSPSSSGSSARPFRRP